MIIEQPARRMTILENGVIEVLEWAFFVDQDTGATLGQSAPHASLHEPGADLTAAAPAVGAVAAAAWTPDVVDRFQTAKAAALKALLERFPPAADPAADPAAAAEPAPAEPAP